MTPRWHPKTTQNRLKIDPKSIQKKSEKKEQKKTEKRANMDEKNLPSCERKAVFEDAFRNVSQLKAAFRHLNCFCVNIVCNILSKKRNVFIKPY